MAPSAVFIVGPTGVGKTALAMALAERLRGEVISADSRQVYRQMDIGTGKPSAEEQRLAPHHLLDLLDPSESFDLATFLALAHAAIDEVNGRGGLPLVTGGTGQYIWALYEGWQVPPAAPDAEFRRSKQLEADRIGPQALHDELAALDPVRASQIDPRNVRRVIRALEIQHFTQRLPSEYGGRAEGPSDAPVLGLQLDREKLYRRIDQRVDQMMSAGFLAEVERLAARGLTFDKGALASPGYRELGQYLSGELTLDEAVLRTKSQTHGLARGQYGWFKPNDPRITWLDAAAPNLVEQASLLVEAFLARTI